jgi:damage-control phosphatase, subfamily I
MKVHLDCIPCFVRQALEAARLLELDEEAATRLMRRTLELTLEVDWNLPPPVVGRDIHRVIREVSGSDDPYLPSKITANETALRLLPEIEQRVAAAADPFHAAVEFSITGNLIDLGANLEGRSDVEAALDHVRHANLDSAAVDRLRRAVEEAETVLFLADNAGEIVFDRPLLERIGMEKLTVAVRGGPTINDATLDDARRAGLTKLYRVIGNGADIPGTWLPACSEELVRTFETVDLVLAKGQGNYETLSDCGRDVFFLLLAKCRMVSQSLGVEPGSFILRTEGSSRR